MRISSFDNFKRYLLIIFFKKEKTYIENRTILCWGRGETGELGSNDILNEISPIILQTPEYFIQCSAGMQFTLFLTSIFSFLKSLKYYFRLSDKGDVFATGLNHQGQLGLGKKSNCYIPEKIQFPDNGQMIKVSASSFSSSLTKNGEIYLWGKGDFGEFLKPTLFSNKEQYFIDIQLNNSFGMALDSKSIIYSWGNNEYGQLGIGTLENRQELTKVKRLDGKNINKFSLGIANFCIGVGDFLNTAFKEGFFFNLKFI